MVNNIINAIGYTGFGDKVPKRKNFFPKTFPIKVVNNQNQTFSEIADATDNLQGQGMKIIIPPNIVDTWTGLEMVLGLKLSGHSDTLSDPSKLIDELPKRGEIENEQRYRNALDKVKFIWRFFKPFVFSAH